MTLSQKLKKSFIDGILLAVPFVVVLFILDLLVDWALVVINPIVQESRLVQYTSNIEIWAQLIAGVFVVALIILLGFLYESKRSLGLRNLFGKYINYVPLFGTIYLSVRQVTSSIGEKDSRFKKLVMVEYPKDNIYTLGLLTSEAPKSLREDRNMYSVFFPNSPNPTGGRTVIVPEEEIIEVDMSVQKGMKLMLTTGIAFDEDELPEEFRE